MENNPTHKQTGTNDQERTLVLREHYCDWLGSRSKPIHRECTKQAEYFINETEYPFWLCGEHYSDYRLAEGKEVCWSYIHDHRGPTECHCGGSLGRRNR
jgi:hypothetical protein